MISFNTFTLGKIFSDFRPYTSIVTLADSLTRFACKNCNCELWTHFSFLPAIHTALSGFNYSYSRPLFKLLGRTVSVLVLCWLHQLFKLHVDMNFDPQEQGDLQQDKLQLANTCRQETGSADWMVWLLWSDRSRMLTHWCGRWSRHKTFHRTFWHRGPAGRGWWRAISGARCSWRRCPSSPAAPLERPWSSAPLLSADRKALHQW